MTLTATYTGRIQVDTWDSRQKHQSRAFFEDWEATQWFVALQVEQGLSCKVQRTPDQTPEVAQ